MKIGIVSDTHGLLRPEVIQAPEGCAAILHGGDISKQEIIDQLEEIAPVYVVGWSDRREKIQAYRVDCMHEPAILFLRLHG